MGGIFILELPIEDSTFKDVHILVPEERDGEVWSSFAGGIVSFAEAGFDKKRRDTRYVRSDGDPVGDCTCKDNGGLEERSYTILVQKDGKWRDCMRSGHCQQWGEEEKTGGLGSDEANEGEVDIYGSHLGL